MNNGIQELNINHELQYEITNFYTREAYMLDHKQFHDWLTLFDESIIYSMPLRVTREKRENIDFSEKMTFFEENSNSLRTRVNKLSTKSAWALDPAPRTRHLITNILIESSDENNRFNVRSSFLVLRSRAEDITNDIIYGERLDIIQKETDTWKIMKRTVYPDQAVLGSQNLSMFF